MGCCASRVRPIKQKEYVAIEKLDESEDKNEHITVEKLDESEDKNEYIAVEKLDEESEGKSGTCQECGEPNSFGDDWSSWCISCNSKHFADKFPYWTSGNEDIDKLIRNTQLTATHYEAVFEWIPYHRFTDIIPVAKGGFGKVSKAKWLDGPVLRWDCKKKQWLRWSCAPVALKTLYNSQNISSNFLEEITKHLRLYKSSDTCSEIVRCHGISQDPHTKEYIMVFEYCARGDLVKYLNDNFNELAWLTRLDHLLDIARGLDTIHSAGLMHGDFHCGNLLIDVTYAAIGDLGLCHPADEPQTKNPYGVLPYIAPEVLRGNPYTQAADIYSFGVIMWVLSSGCPPFHNVPHDHRLQIQICRGARPETIEGVPECYEELMKKCWHNNPKERPDTSTIIQTIEEWLNVTSVNDDSVWHKADNNRVLIENKPISIHPQAVYISRLFISCDSCEELRIEINSSVH